MSCCEDVWLGMCVASTSPAAHYNLFCKCTVQVRYVLLGAFANFRGPQSIAVAPSNPSKDKT